MTPGLTLELLKNYRLLIDKVDERCSEILQLHAPHIRCTKGCDECCQHISVFPVEAVALAWDLQSQPEKRKEHIRSRAGSSFGEDPCPLLEEGLCLLYEARPVICRTHGFPLVTRQNGKQTVDFCPLNFTTATSLPGNALILMDHLNEMLAVINGKFLADYPGSAAFPERILIGEALNIRF